MSDDTFFDTISACQSSERWPTSSGCFLTHEVEAPIFDPPPTTTELARRMNNLQAQQLNHVDVYEVHKTIDKLSAKIALVESNARRRKVEWIIFIFAVNIFLDIVFWTVIVYGAAG